MSTTTRRKAPTQYHRRLRLLAAVVVVILLGLVVQAVRLTVVQGDQHRRTAEARLQSRTWLPTWRGSMLDRDGRILARDVPRWEVAVSWDAITGQWAEDRAVRRARSDLGRDFWRMASPERRAAEIAARRPVEDAVLNQLWDAVAAAAGESRDELASRLNAIRAILHHVDRLRDVDVDGVEPLNSPHGHCSRLHPDVPETPLPVDAVLAMAPAREGDYISVPKVLDGGGAA
jgi:aspartyl-tRNA(Asn)/glutamyl-tRNA(Gln) amidotransferase subunit C